MVYFVSIPKGKATNQLKVELDSWLADVSIPKGEATNNEVVTMNKLKEVSIPKGEATNFSSRIKTLSTFLVSIPKGEATNTLESLILLYQLYAMVSMFLYQYIISK